MKTYVPYVLSYYNKSVLIIPYNIISLIVYAERTKSTSPFIKFRANFKERYYVVISINSYNIKRINIPINSNSVDG